MFALNGEDEGISQPLECGMGEENHSCEGSTVLSELYLRSSGGFLFLECECLRFYCNIEVRACDIHLTSESTEPAGGRLRRLKVGQRSFGARKGWGFALGNGNLWQGKHDPEGEEWRRILTCSFRWLERRLRKGDEGNRR